MDKSAVVFAYHDVGVRCLRVLHNAGIQVRLVVTHQDNPKEKIWFASVAEVAKQLGLPVVTPENPNDPEFVSTLKSIAPDFIFSFYYRQMLSKEILDIPRLGAFNMHGSLLPKYRGRVPINWAIIHGETETGATLHAMTEKPDAGFIVDQKSVPILPDDTAQDVFTKVVDAAEEVLQRTIGKMIAGEVPRFENNLKEGSYFGGRKPEDGRIDCKKNTQEIYNLIRAVAPPFPGAYIETAQKPHFFIYKARQVSLESKNREFPVVFLQDEDYYLQIENGTAIKILECGFEGEKPMPASAFFKREPINLPWRIE